MSRFKNPFITFEGTEGAGKSTVLREIAELLRKRGHQVLCTREPGGTPMAEKIRNLILQEKMNEWTELFLYEAARAEHVMTHVKPALSRGEVVLCDRFTDSSLAYQSSARGLNWKTVSTLNGIATQKLVPHLTIWLDLDPEAGLRRVRDPNRFEAEGVAFQKKVRLGFRRAMREQPKRWYRVDVSKKSIPEVVAAVMKEIEKRFL